MKLRMWLIVVLLLAIALAWARPRIVAFNTRRFAGLFVVGGRVQLGVYCDAGRGIRGCVSLVITGNAAR